MLYRFKNTVDRILDGKNKAGGKLSQLAAGVHFIRPHLQFTDNGTVNLLGQPIYEATLDGELGNPHGNLILDSPYELKLSNTAPAGVSGNLTASPTHTPFSLAELERVLRLYDADPASLRFSYGPQGKPALAGVPDRRQRRSRSPPLSTAHGGRERAFSLLTPTTKGPARRCGRGDDRAVTRGGRHVRIPQDDCTARRGARCGRRGRQHARSAHDLVERGVRRAIGSTSNTSDLAGLVVVAPACALAEGPGDSGTFASFAQSLSR